MKTKCLFLLLVCILLTACGAQEPMEYAQAVLPAPERIEVDGGSSVITYEPDSENYQKLFASLSANWWLTGGSGTDLEAVTSLEALKTTTYDTNRHSVGDIVFFIYEKEPIAWDVTEEERISVSCIGFVVPEAEQESEIPVKGTFLVSQTMNWGTNEGLYTYFYPPEIANDLWGFLKKE